MSDATVSIQTLRPDVCQAIDGWIAKYPKEHKRSALLAALHIVQRAYGGWISEPLMRAVADYLDVPPMAVYEAVNFYHMYEKAPVGLYKLSICYSISCHLCGSDRIVSHLEKTLGIQMGETTPDGLFTLKRVECLAACTDAPILQVNDRDYHRHLTPESIDTLLDQLRLEAKRSRETTEEEPDAN